VSQDNRAVSPGTKPYEVEHIWADKFDQHRSEFEQQHEFDNYRNRIGDLVLLPQGTNQSYGAMSYAEKLGHYLKENLLVKSLHPKAYENNPNFVGMSQTLGFKFRAHKSFAKSDIDERQAMIRSISEVIWSWVAVTTGLAAIGQPFAAIETRMVARWRFGPAFAKISATREPH
jgi:hypothetical protein